MADRGAQIGSRSSPRPLSRRTARRSTTQISRPLARRRRRWPRPHGRRVFDRAGADSRRGVMPRSLRHHSGPRRPFAPATRRASSRLVRNGSTVAAADVIRPRRYHRGAASTCPAVSIRRGVSVLRRAPHAPALVTSAGRCRGGLLPPKPHTVRSSGVAREKR